MKIIGGPALWSRGCLIRWSDWSTWSADPPDPVCSPDQLDPLDPPDQLDPLIRRIRHYQNLRLITFFGAFYKMDSLKLFWMHLGKQTQCVWKGVIAWAVCKMHDLVLGYSIFKTKIIQQIPASPRFSHVWVNSPSLHHGLPQRHGPESPMREKPMRTLVSIKWPFPVAESPSSAPRWALLLLSSQLPTNSRLIKLFPAEISPVLQSAFDFSLRSLDFSILFSKSGVNGPCSSGLDSHLMAPTHSSKVSGVVNIKP